MGGALLAISFQSHSWAWGGIIRVLTQGAYLVTLVMIAGQLTAARGVHPVGHRRRVITAGIPAVLAAAVGGWFWTAPPDHGTLWPVTPLAAVGLHLISKGNR